MKQQTRGLQKQEKVSQPAGPPEGDLLSFFFCTQARVHACVCVRACADLLNRYDIQEALAPCWTSWVGTPPYALAHHGSQFDAGRRHKSSPRLLAILPPRLVHLVILKIAAHGRYST